MPSAHLLIKPKGPGQRILAYSLLVCMILSGCANFSKSPQVQREKYAKQDEQNMRLAQAPKGPAATAKKEASSTQPPAPPLNLSKPLTLDQAISFALEHNLEALVAAQEKTVQDEMATGAVFRMLPSLLVDGDYSKKSWDVPSTSISAYSHEVSLEPSISSELLSRTANLTLSWDILNLGLNMMRWQQARERTKAAGERLRRLKQDIVLNVSRAYLKAQVAKDAAERAASLLEDINKREQIINKQIAEGSLSKLDGLQNDASMTEMAMRLKTFSNEYRTSMAELAELLGVRPDEGLAVADINLAAPPSQPQMDLTAFEKEALRQRPELFQQDVEQNISIDDANAALIQMFPSLTPYAKYSYDSNKYLSRNDWYIVGVRLSWDLFSLPKSLYDRFTAQQQAQLAAKKRLRLALAVTTQIKLAVIECQETMDRLELSRKLESERYEVLDMVRDQVRQGKLKESLLLDEDQRYLNARVQHLTNYAGLLAAQARLQNSLGRDWKPTQAVPVPASANP